MSKEFLMVVQTPTANSGRLGLKLSERGYTVRCCYPNDGEALPENLHDFAGAAMLGGPMSANDDDTLPGLRAELDWLPKVIEAELPFLGVCLGAQLLARSLGAKVKPHPEGMAEIGYFPIQPTVEGKEFISPNINVYQWHMEGFDLPAGATLLAQGERFPNQAYRYGRNAFGIQFHPEVTGEIMETWLDKGSHRLVLPGAQQPDEQRENFKHHHNRLGDWLNCFLDNILEMRAVTT